LVGPKSRVKRRKTSFGFFLTTRGGGKKKREPLLQPMVVGATHQKKGPKEEGGGPKTWLGVIRPTGSLFRGRWGRKKPKVPDLTPRPGGN